MKLSQAVVVVLGIAFASQALLIPDNGRALSLPESAPIEQRHVLYNELERRKGGGGGAKGGGGGSSSGGKGGSGSSSGTSSGLDTARRSLLTCNQVAVLQDRPLATAAAPPALPPALVYVQRMARVENTTAAELQFHTKPD